MHEPHAREVHTRHERGTAVRVFACLALCSLAAPAAAQNRVLVLDGDEDFALAKEIAGFDDAPGLTFELWARAEGPMQDGLMLGVLDATLSDGLVLRTSCGGAGALLAFETRRPGQLATVAAAPAAPLCDGAWHHVAAVDDGSATHLYLDGAWLASGPSFAQPWDLENAYIGVGGIVFASDGWFHGALDEARIWRRALGPAEVRELAAGGPPANATDLAVRYPFDTNLFDPVGFEHALPAGDMFLAPESVRRAPLARFPARIARARGGSVALTLDAGAAAAGAPYIVLASASGTAPGVPLPGVSQLGSAPVLPLVRDGWLLASLFAPNAPPYTNSAGVLDAAGRAVAHFTLPPLPAAVGAPQLTLHHAALVFDAQLGLRLVTNAVAFAIE
jgi:hypothetical protein